MDADALQAQHYAKRMINLDRSGRNKPQVIESVAAKAGLLPGTVMSALKLRLKGTAPGVYARLRGALIRELELERRRLEHELDLVRKASDRPDDPEIFAVEESLKKARETLDRARG